MTEYERIERAPLSQWIAESLRATAFPSAEAEVKSDSWWRAVLGEEPENQVVRPRTGERREEGTFQGASLILKVEPTRIDWILRPKLSTEKPPEGFSAIGSFQDSYLPFRELMRRWFPLNPPLERLAFGAAALLPVANKTEGYKRLAAYLPALHLESKGWSDLLYRINRPRPSKSNIPSLRINRLCTWSVAQTQVQLLSLSPPPQRPQVIDLEPAFACRVELDINTSPEFEGQFSGQQCAEIFDELLDLAQEILQEGDRP